MHSPITFLATVAGVSAGAISNYHQRTIFNQIVALGDSFSDTGNLFRLSGNNLPPPPHYKGRFANGTLWIEQLAEKYAATLTNFAVAGATSDDSQFQVSFEQIPNVRIDGCMEQMRSLRLNSSLQHVSPDETLISLAFFGNDFSYAEKGATAENMVTTLSGCLANVLDYTNSHHVLIPTSNSVKVIPRFFNLPQQHKDYFRGSSVGLRQQWAETIPHFARYYPETFFYSFDYEKFINEIAEGNSPFTPKKFIVDCCIKEDPPSMCPNSSEYLFWDNFHVNQEVHEAMVQAIDDLLNLRSDDYGFAYLATRGKIEVSQGYYQRRNRL